MRPPVLAARSRGGLVKEATLVVSRDRELRLLARVGIRGEAASRILNGVRFPATAEQVDNQLGRHGMTLDWFISAMGGSP